MAKKIYDAVATIGKYKDRNGETRKRYINVGSVFETDKGQLSLKLDAVPVGQDWSGWVSFFEPKERDGGNQRQGRDVSAAEAEERKMHGSEKRVTNQTQADDETDDIPF